MPSLVAGIEVVRRALLTLLAVAVLLLPLPLGDRATDAGPACCGQTVDVASADVASVDVATVDVASDACCDACDEPAVADGDDAAHHPCCSDGCHCACCGRLPLDQNGADDAPSPARRPSGVTRLAHAPGDPAPLAIFDPPRA